MNQNTSYRTICDAGWKTRICIETDSDFHPAYEVHEYPGVIRFEEDQQPVPLDMCRAMGWPHLDEQKTAIEKQESAYAQLMAM